ncbi:class I SAM-dependent DNA methyltransferase, partial [Apilactobacillus sp. F1]|nr:class I SAM-dependent DNA methyltransferase [Apilactobacillus sp. F1]
RQVYPSDYKDDKFVQDIIKKVYNHRINSKRKSTKELAKTPQLFGEIRWSNNQAIIIPRVSSQNRRYIPMGIVSPNVVISDSAMSIYNAPLWLLGLLQSNIHMVWTRAVGGKLGNGLRYSAGLVYNTFPIPFISTQKKRELEELTLRMLDIRDEEGGSLIDLYGSPLSDKNSIPMNDRLK